MQSQGLIYKYLCYKLTCSVTLFIPWLYDAATPKQLTTLLMTWSISYLFDTFDHYIHSEYLGTLGIPEYSLVILPTRYLLNYLDHLLPFGYLGPGVYMFIWGRVWMRYRNIIPWRKNSYHWINNKWSWNLGAKRSVTFIALKPCSELKAKINNLLCFKYFCVHGNLGFAYGHPFVAETFVFVCLI